MTKTITTAATAMLAVICCKVRRSSYQPLCLKMSRKKPPNPLSKPSPRAVLIKDSRKNTADSLSQTSASEPGKPWLWARRQATAVPCAEQAGDPQCYDTRDIVRHSSNTRTHNDVVSTTSAQRHFLGYG